MYSNEGLSISGYNNTVVRNTIARQGSKKLAVILPGSGYSCDAPLLYFSRLTLWNNGWDLLSITFDHATNPAFMRLSEDRQDYWFEQDIKNIFRAVANESAYENILIVGKSWGTTAMLHMLGNFPDPRIRGCVWITPGTANRQIYTWLSHSSLPAMVFTGTRDRHYHEELVAKLDENSAAQTVVISDADHSLEIQGDEKATLDILKTICGNIGAFAARL